MPPTKKRLAFVQDWLTTYAGGEQTLLALHQLYPEAPIYTSLHNPQATPQFAQARVVPSYLQKLAYLRRHHQLAIPLMPMAFESFDLSGYDTVVSVGGGLSKGVITQPGQRHISYCHTPIRYIWKLGGDDRNDNRFDSGLRQAASHYLRLWDVASAHRVDQFVANSRNVADRIEKIYRLPSTVVYPPVDTERFQPSGEKPQPYFLSLNRLVEYKKVDLIVRACKESHTPLKVVGGGPMREALVKLAADAPWIEILGRVPDAEMVPLVANAQALIQAAEEDFGIVPVEVMAAGRPVLAYGKGGLIESVLDGKTGLFFKEQSVASLVECLERFASHSWDAASIRRHALRFDISVFKEKMSALIEVA